MRVSQHLAPLQLFLVVTLLWGNIVDTCNIVFMVFGGASETDCTNSTAAGNASSANCTAQVGKLSEGMDGWRMGSGQVYIFNSMVPDLGLEGDATGVALLTTVQLCGALFGALLGGFLSGTTHDSWMVEMGGDVLRFDRTTLQHVAVAGCGDHAGLRLRPPAQLGFHDGFPVTESASLPLSPQ